MLAEKCPNCGAFLPVRRADVEVRTCEFCELEVPGGLLVEVDHLTTRRRRPSDTQDATSTWLPPPSPVRDVEPVTRGGRRGPLAIVVIAFLAVGALVVGIAISASRKTKGGAATATMAEAPAEVRTVAPAPPPRLEQVALVEAVTAAGGVEALDPVAMLPFVDGRARAAAADVVLLAVHCFPVRAGGRADLTLAGGRCSFEYRSPAGTERPADVPVGVSMDYPCLVQLDIDKDVDEVDARVSRSSLRHCRIHHAVRPPRCTTAEIWTRAAAAGAPADAVARLRYAGRYRSGYDPVDPDDAFDVPERGRWTVTIDRDGGDDLRYQLVDDCGQTPPTADELAVLAALKKATPAFRRCFTQAAGAERSIQALELIWRLTIGERGAVTIAFADPGVDIEGMFQGDLGAIRTRWATCVDAVGRGLRLPAALGEVRLDLRLEQTGPLIVAPPPFD